MTKNASKSNEKKLKLIESDEDELNEKGLSINKSYAERYDNWREKEELQKLKDKYGDVDNLNSSDESTEESEDEEAKELTKEIEKEFFKALSMVKSRDKKIYDKDHCKFFDINDNGEQVEDKSKKSDKKPLFMKDLEREIILKKVKKADDGVEDAADSEIDSEDEKEIRRQEKVKLNDKGYYEEQDEIKKSFKSAYKNEDLSDEEGFLSLKQKTKAEKEKEETDYIEWLKGHKEKIEDPDVEQMKYLHDYWNDPNLTQSEKYLRDYILNRRYLEKSDNESDQDDDDLDNNNEKKTKITSTNSEADGKIKAIDFVEFSEEEDIIENQEEFERKYNFRFEDPDPEFIKSYPRTVADSMRRKDTKRKEKREEHKKRKEAEKQKKKEEIKRLKNLKKKEIMNKINKIKKVTGTEDLKLDVNDLDDDFDPVKYEQKMQKLFDDNYYQMKDPLINSDNENEDDKPVFTDDDEEDLKYMDWDKWEGDNDKALENNNNESKKKSKKKKKNRKDEQDEIQDPDFEMDCDKLEPLNGKKLSKFSEAVLNKKPVFDPNDKSFEEYFDEYYKLDCEDVIGGDLPCRFKYREVVPNDYGLDVEEILSAKDTELNQWASLKKAVLYRPVQNEIAEVKEYKSKKNAVELKKKILHSLFEQEEENQENGSEINLENTPIQTDKKVQDSEKVENNRPKPKEPVDQDHKTKRIKEEKTNGKIKNDKFNKKKKNKNVMESMTEERLKAYGIDPKKFKKKLKYSKKNDDKKMNWLRVNFLFK